MKNRRHKWTGKVGTNQDDLVVGCLKCGMVKQTIKGFPTYFIDDTLYDKYAPECDERLIIKED